METEEKLLTARVVAERLNVSLSKVYKDVDDGVIPSVRLGRSVRIPSQRLQEWILANSTSGRTTR